MLDQPLNARPPEHVPARRDRNVGLTREPRSFFVVIVNREAEWVLEPEKFDWLELTTHAFSSGVVSIFSIDVDQYVDLLPESLPQRFGGFNIAAFGMPASSPHLQRLVSQFDVAFGFPHQFIEIVQLPVSQDVPARVERNLLHARAA